MNLSQKVFLDLLEGQEDHCHLNHTPLEMSQLYVHCALLVTATGYIKEQLWLKRKEIENIDYSDFLAPVLLEHLVSLNFLEDFLVKNGEKKLKAISKLSKKIEADIISNIGERSGTSQKEFITESLKSMMALFMVEEEAQVGRLQSLGHLGMDLYRTFDKLDDLFDLNYQLDIEMDFDHTIKERLYAGAGVGVQSGYSTILLALENTKLKLGGKVIDLGSGYGRVGLVYSLLRPDIDFIGYEYVSHRVEVSRIATEALGLEDKLSFEVQDLSLDSFCVPDADVYYLYDPFTKETYKYILEQLVEVSLRRPISIVTKGNARPWLMEIAKNNKWPKPQLIDEGNLCIFTSS